MECSICYTCEANCKLVCGHSFCKGCVKNWYHKEPKDGCSCPMCRKPLYFKGMMKYLKLWEEEKILHGYTEIFNEVIEELTDPDECDVDDWTIEDVMDVQDKFQKIIKLYHKGYVHSFDEVRYILSCIWVNLELETSYDVCKSHDEEMRYYQIKMNGIKNKKIKRGVISRNRSKKIINGYLVDIIVELFLE